MRTTLQLDDDLLAEAEAVATESGRTLADVVEDALREALSHKARSPRHRPIRLTASGSGGLQPGVNLDRSAELLDVMDGMDAPA